MGPQLQLKPFSHCTRSNWASVHVTQHKLEDRRQPWKDVWPPTSTNADRGVWAKSEFPEATSWKFDSARPFDRPWRGWTRTSTAKSEMSSLSLESREAVGKGHCERTSSQRTFSHPADALIRRKSMATVKLASFGYLAPLEVYETEKPYLSRLPALPGFARTNILRQNRPVEVHEVSGHESLFKLDECGFEFTNIPGRFGEWSNSSICETYMPMLRPWLKEHLNCEDVYIYAYSFRGNSHGKSKDKTWKAPFFRAHCDATPTSCSRRLSLYLPPELKKAANRKRVRFLNVWRPLTTPCQDSPLALCDFRTVSADDLVATDIIFPHYLDEAYEILYNPNHRWFYKRGMQDGDVIVFKLADTADQVATLCPHAAFLDPSVPVGTPERASVEIRVIAIG